VIESENENDWRQTCRPADLQTCRPADLQTCRPADLGARCSVPTMMMVAAMMVSHPTAKVEKGSIGQLKTRSSLTPCFNPIAAHAEIR
jgi:hypothetical protein